MMINTLFVAFLLVSVAAAHDQHWSRRFSHRAVARAAKPVNVAEPAVVPVPVSRRQSLRRRTCKPPSNTTSTALPTGTAGVLAASDSLTATKASTKHSTTKTTSSTKETSTSSSPSSSSGGGGVLSLNALFPMGQNSNSWTTSPKSDDALPLSDSTLDPTKEISALAHPYTAAPDGKQSMRATYPEGSWTFGHDPEGGISFYSDASGNNHIDVTKAKEVTLGYSVFFEEGFEFNQGGKLPGFYGGDSAEEAVSCSGGRRSTQCYSARLMWRTGGAGELYTYLPDYEVSGFSANKAVCNVAPFSECNPTYGASIGRGSFHFATGAWTTVAQRVRLNDAGQANGELQLWVNGKSVINVDGLKFRDSSSGAHRGIQMQTFFGGSDSDWASPKTQHTYFSDFSVAITEML